MKLKHLFAVLAILAMAVLAIGSASTPKADTARSGSSGPDELDVAIRDASDYLNDNIPKGSKIVILNIQSSSPDLSDYIIDELLANAVADKTFSVVDRQQLDIIRAEQNFQWSGEVDDKAAVDIGKLLGAQTIVSGAVNRLGTGYRIRIRALEVQTAQVQGQYNRNIDSSRMITAIIEGGDSGGTRTAAAAGNTGRQTAQTAAPAAPAYKIGDTGPAGGLIFYDKGNNNGGWRYLEAAPEEAEFSALWSVHNTQVDNTQGGIGYGKRNTQLIVEKFRQTSGEWDTAAQKADELVLNGFDDWFLPSKDELDQMYGNLKRRNMGDFKNEKYWSSTEGGDYGYHWRYTACFQNFEDGIMDIVNWGTKNNRKFYVRSIRQVAGPAR